MTFLASFCGLFSEQIKRLNAELKNSASLGFYMISILHVGVVSSIAGYKRI